MTLVIEQAAFVHRPQECPRSSSRVFRDEDVVASRAHQRPAIEIRGPSEESGHDDVATRIGGESLAAIPHRTSAATVRPDVRPTRGRILRDEHVAGRVRLQQSTAKVGGIPERPRHGDIAAAVHGDRVAPVIAIDVAQTPRPHGDTRRSKLSYQYIVLRIAVHRPGAHVHRAHEVAGERDVATGIDRDRLRRTLGRIVEVLGPAVRPVCARVLRHEQVVGDPPGIRQRPAAEVGRWPEAPDDHDIPTGGIDGHAVTTVVPAAPDTRRPHVCAIDPGVLRNDDVVVDT